MNPRFLAFVATLAAALTALGAADLSGVISLIPDDWAKWLAISLPSAAAFAHFLNIFGDVADDGKRNNSFNSTLKVLPIMLWLTAGVLAFGLTSCGTGTILKFGATGIEIIPPATPIVIPIK